MQIFTGEDALQRLFARMDLQRSQEAARAVQVSSAKELKAILKQAAAAPCVCALVDPFEKCITEVPIRSERAQTWAVTLVPAAVKAAMCLAAEDDTTGMDWGVTDAFGQLHMFKIFMQEFPGRVPELPGTRIGNKKTLLGRLAICRCTILAHGEVRAYVHESIGPGDMAMIRGSMEWQSRTPAAMDRFADHAAELEETSRAAGPGVQVVDIGGPRGLQCATCHAVAQDGKKLLRCSACQGVRYCSVACQEKDWPRHQKECKQFAAVAAPAQK